MGGLRTNVIANENGLRVECDTGAVGRFRVNTDSVWVRVGQRIRRGNAQEMWDSVAVEGNQEQDGTVVVRVLIFNPDSDEPLQIASIRSCPRDPKCLTALSCNLNHVGL